VDSEERAEGPVTSQDSVQAACDKGSEDGASSHPQLSPHLSSGPEERREEVVTEESWRRDSSRDEERTESQRITRRKWGSGRRSRPRPLSDYGQLATRSLSIPEDSVAVDPQKEDTVEGDRQPNTASADAADQNPAMGSPKGSWRRRPISVIGGLSFYGNSPTEEIESLLTRVRPGVLLPKLTEPSSFLAFVLPYELNRLLLFFLLSASRTTDSQPFFLTLKTLMN